MTAQEIKVLDLVFGYKKGTINTLEPEFAVARFNRLL